MRAGFGVQQIWGQVVARPLCLSGRSWISYLSGPPQIFTAEAWDRKAVTETFVSLLGELGGSDAPLQCHAHCNGTMFGSYNNRFSLRTPCYLVFNSGTS